MKITPFYNIHQELGAKLVDFAGYLMPVQYDGIISEHLRVREKAGLFDVSHMGEFWVKGEDALAFVDYATTNNVRSLNIGQVQYSTMCTADGGIVDDLLVYRFKDRFLLVVNASNIAKDWVHLINLSKNFRVELENVSDDMALVALQGPASMDILGSISNTDLNSLPFYHFVEGEIDGMPMIISRTGYTGELGYELYHDGSQSAQLWKALMTAGRPHGLGPVGLGARDTLRMEMKFCLYGNDIDETTNPLEARLSWVVDMDGPDFHGKSALLDHKKKGINRFLVAFEMLERGLPRHGYPIYKNEDSIGVVTSGGQSPTLKKGIGLAYINRPYHKIGTDIEIDIRGRRLMAKIIKPPFINKKAG